MAAAIVPLITTVAPEIIKLITGLVHTHAPVAEQTMGPGTGPVKFAAVFQAVLTALQNAAAAGTISKELPADEAIKTIIESVVTSLNLQGVLESPGSASSIARLSTVKLAAGQSVTVSA